VTLDPLSCDDLTTTPCFILSCKPWMVCVVCITRALLVVSACAPTLSPVIAIRLFYFPSSRLLLCHIHIFADVKVSHSSTFHTHTHKSFSCCSLSHSKYYFYHTAGVMRVQVFINRKPLLLLLPNCSLIVRAYRGSLVRGLWSLSLLWGQLAYYCQMIWRARTAARGVASCSLEIDRRPRLSVQDSRFNA